MTRHLRYSFAVLAAAATFSAADANAFTGYIIGPPQTPCGATCCYDVGDLDLSGDNFYGPAGGWDWCNDNWLASMAEGYGMDEDYWDGHGWFDACNTTNPFGRMMTGLVTLNETSPNKAWPNTSARDGNILRWGPGWVWETVDELLVSCSSDASLFAECDCSGVDYDITMFVPKAFYPTNTVERASTLLHEARHWDGPAHDAGSDDTLDSSWEFNGAWRWEVAWLAWYAAEATPATLDLRCSAEALANSILGFAFVDAPGFLVQTGVCDI